MRRGPVNTAVTMVTPAYMGPCPNTNTNTRDHMASMMEMVFLLCVFFM